MAGCSKRSTLTSMKTVVTVAIKPVCSGDLHDEIVHAGNIASGDELLKVGKSQQACGGTIAQRKQFEAIPEDRVYVIGPQGGG